MSVGIALLFGELLVRQSSGRHLPEPVGEVLVEGAVSGPWMLGGSVQVAGRRQESVLVEQLSLRLRPALWGGLRLGEGKLQPDLALGLGLALQGSQWIQPEEGWFWRPSPMVGLRGGLELGGHWGLRLQAGVELRAGGADFLLALGGRWR
ncbi:MAG TPA: hypothetical protein PKY30_04415 [Myxococcota bacterium]|nr:hypothetical protein [Myxococcota bacterium]HND31883.1 hypothetical protein [Myxococcota bacterium]HNH46252.1 hypothetical protein [Myxococcota bacterium]